MLRGKDEKKNFYTFLNNNNNISSFNKGFGRSSIYFD